MLTDVVDRERVPKRYSKSGGWLGGGKRGDVTSYVVADRVTAPRRACSPWKLLWLWTSYLFNHLATLNFFPPRIKFERKIGRRIRPRLNFHGYIFLDQSRFFCFSLHFNNKLIDWVFCLIKLSFCFVITRCIFVFLFHHNRACNIGRLNTK